MSSFVVVEYSSSVEADCTLIHYYCCCSCQEQVIGCRCLRSLNIHQLRRRSIQWLQWKAVIACYRWSSVLPVKLLLIYSTLSTQPRFTVSY